MIYLLSLCNGGRLQYNDVPRWNGEEVGADVIVPSVCAEQRGLYSIDSFTMLLFVVIAFSHVRFTLGFNLALCRPTGLTLAYIGGKRPRLSFRTISKILKRLIVLCDSDDSPDRYRYSFQPV